MWLILGILFIASTLMISFIMVLLFKNLPNTKERLKFALPILIVVIVILVCYLFKWHMPTGEIGKFI